MFYSARNTRGKTIAVSGDCEEMNSPAASHRFCDAGWETSFRPDNPERPQRIETTRIA
jgi:hypothetical protein